MKRKTTWQASGGLIALGVVVAFLIVGSVTNRPARRDAALLDEVDGASAHPFALPDEVLDFVDDRAALLVPYRDRLEHLARQNAERMGIEFHVVTQRDAAADLDELAIRAFGQRSVSADAAGAVLLLVEPGGGRASISASAALRELFPDLWLRALADYELAPFAESRDLGRVLVDAVERMNARAIERARIGQWLPPASVRERPEYRRALGRVAGGLDASLPVPRSDVPRELRQRLPADRRARYAPSTSVAGSVSAVVRAFAELAGDPTLELFTPGSQCMRARRPAAPAEYWRRADALEASQPFALREQGDRAVAHSHAPALGFEPLFLERIDGVWRVDAMSMARLLRPLPGGGVAVTDRDHSYAFAVVDLSLHHRERPDPDVEPLDLAGEHPLDAVARLESQLALRPSGDAHFQLAELLFRNCWATADALAHYERAASLDPEDRRKVEVAANRGVALELDLWATPYLRALGESHYERLASAYRNAARIDEARHFYQLAIAHEPTRSAQRALGSLRPAPRR